MIAVSIAALMVVALFRVSQSGTSKSAQLLWQFDGYLSPEDARWGPIRVRSWMGNRVRIRVCSTSQSQQMLPTRLVAASMGGIDLGEFGTKQENLG